MNVSTFFMVLDKVRLSQYLEVKNSTQGDLDCSSILMSVVEWNLKVTKTGNSKQCIYSPRHLIGRQEKFFVFTLERAYSADVYKNIEIVA